MKFHKTALAIAVKNKFVDIVRLLLSSDKIDVNLICISNFDSF